MTEQEKIEEIVKRCMDKYFEKFIGEIKNELRNENGNSSIRQSGNGIVYVDNTGIAYALALFYYQMMSQESKEQISIEEILKRLDGVIEENRKVFQDMIQGLKSDDN